MGHVDRRFCRGDVPRSFGLGAEIVAVPELRSAEAIVDASSTGASGSATGDCGTTSERVIGAVLGRVVAKAGAAAAARSCAMTVEACAGVTSDAGACLERSESSGADGAGDAADARCEVTVAAGAFAETDASMAAAGLAMRSAAAARATFALRL